MFIFDKYKKFDSKSFHIHFFFTYHYQQPKSKMSNKAIANMTGLPHEDVEEIRKNLTKQELAQKIVDALYGHDSLAASNPEKTIKSLKALLMRGLQPDASDDERIISAKQGEWIARMESSPEGGRELLRLILLWE